PAVQDRDRGAVRRLPLDRHPRGRRGEAADGPSGQPAAAVAAALPVSRPEPGDAAGRDRGKPDAEQERLMRRQLLATAFVVPGLLLQATVVNRLPLPEGWPDLVVLVVIALALVGGPAYGAVVGFSAGLAADVLPPG